MTFLHGLSTNNYGPNKFIVATSSANGTHTTLGAALTAASSGDTIYLRDSVTENVTITKNVTITSYVGSEQAPAVSITGKITIASAITVAISGIQLITNSDFALVVSSANAATVILTNCFINALNNTAISYTNSNASSNLGLYFCTGNIGTTGITYFANSSIGSMDMTSCSEFLNTGASTTASTLSSSGGLTMQNVGTFNVPITTSSTCALNIDNCRLNTSATNSTALTLGSSGFQRLRNVSVSSGSAVGISCSGSSIVLANIVVDSTNTNAIDGAGSVNTGSIDFPNSSLVSTSTKTHTPIGESGSFTPTLLGAVAGATTYTTQTGVYNVIGNVVFITGRIVITAATGTGNAQIGGLPFANNLGFNAEGVVSMSGATWAWPAARTTVQLDVANAAVFGTMQSAGTATTTSPIQMTNGAATINFSIFYPIA